MSQPRFVDSAACASRLHCAACRKIGGAWYAQHQAVFSMPGIDAAECPAGLAGQLVQVAVAERVQSAAIQTRAPRAPIRPIAPVPESEWPWYIKTLATFRTADERGAGDTWRRQLTLGGKEIVKIGLNAALKFIGKRCNCDAEQQRMNAKYRYPD